MKTTRLIARARLFLAVAGCFLSAGLVRADVLSQVPADSAIVVKFNHLSDTNQKLAGMLQQLGVTDLVPTMKDPLQALEDTYGLGGGINSKGDAAIFVTADAAKTMSGEMMRFGHAVALLPVSDYKAFIASMETVRTENETTVVHVKNDNKELFVQQWGDYAAITGEKELLAVKHEGLKTTGTSETELANDDIVFFTNFAALKPILLPKLEESENDLIEQVKKQVPDAGHQKVAIASAHQAIQLAREFLNDAQGSAAGVTLTSGGVKGSLTVDFAPDSYLGKLAMSLKQTDGPLLSGLPKQNYIVMSGFVQDPAVTTKLFDNLVGPVLADLPGMGDDGKKAADMIAAFRGLVSTSDSGAVGVVVPTGALKQTSLIQEVIVTKGDSAKMKDGMSKAMELNTTLMTAFMKFASSWVGGPGDGIGADLFKTTATPNFKTVAGVAFDRWLIQVDPDNTSTMAMQMGQAFGYMYGPDGMSILGGVVDGKTFIAGIGLQDELLNDSVASAKSGEDVLTATLKDIDAQLPKKRAAVEYLGLGQYLSTVLSYMKAQGLPINITLSPTLPPIGVALSVDGAALRVDGYMPMPLIQGVSQAVMQAYMQFQPHAGGGGL